LKGGNRRLATVTVAVAVVLAIAVVVLRFWSAAFVQRALPAHPTDVVVPRGTGSGAVAELLRARGVIGDPFAFRMLARLRGVDREVQAGEYVFAPHETLDEVLGKLVRGEARVAQWVTIPEGYTSDQIAQDLADHKLGAATTYEAYFKRTTIVLGGVRTLNLEGYLFPSTYLFPLDATPEIAGRILVDQFEHVLPADAPARARRLGFTLPQVVTVASLVEREAKADDERPLIAGVIYNRLRRGMALQVDASLEYAFPSHKTEITRADLRIDSPYNTYLHPGLPPTPIANPGLPSLLAALHPKHTDYYYYVYKGSGHHAFARTLEEHNANVERYLH
jgi:UPF0755 protein